MNWRSSWRVFCILAFLSAKKNATQTLTRSKQNMFWNKHDVWINFTNVLNNHLCYYRMTPLRRWPSSTSQAGLTVGFRKPLTVSCVSETWSKMTDLSKTDQSLFIAGKIKMYGKIYIATTWVLNIFKNW